MIVIRAEILTLVLDQNVRAAHAAFDEAREAAAQKGPDAEGAEIIDFANRHPSERAL